MSNREVSKLERAAHEWLDNCRAIGRSKSTVASYETAVKKFVQWYDASEYKGQEPSFHAVQAFRNKLLESKSNRTVKQYLTVLKMFFGWCCDPAMGEDRIFSHNPVASSLLPDTKRENARPYNIILPDDAVIQLFANEPPASGNYKKRTWARNYAIVSIFLTMGIRNSELLDLRLSDVDFEHSEIKIERGKGNKFRVVDMPELAKTAIELYLRSGVRPDDLNRDDYLFGTTGGIPQSNMRGEKTAVSCKWKQGTRQWLSDVVERHVYSVTGISRVTSHDLRHVCARVDLNSGMSISELQAKLGHSSPNVTQIYSGRIMARRSRDSATSVIVAQENQAMRNEAMLAENEEGQIVVSSEAHRNDHSGVELEGVKSYARETKSAHAPEFQAQDSYCTEFSAVYDTKYFFCAI